MSGLFGTSLDDPRTMGMMQLVGGLMSSPRFGQGMSQGLLAYGDTMQRAKQQQAQDQLRQMQMKQMQLQMQQQEEQARQTQLRRQALQGAFSPGSPGFLSPGDGDVPATPGGFDMSRYANLLAKAGDFEGALPAFQALQKDDTPIPLADGGELRRRDGTLIARNEKAPKEVETTPLAKLIAERDKYPLGHPMRTIYDQRIRKESTHQPPASPTVTMLTPVPGYQIGPDGKLVPVYIQPGNRPGVAPSVLPGVVPPQLAEEQRELAEKSHAAAQKASSMLSTIELARNHPGRATGTGLSSALHPNNYIPGTDAKNFSVVLDQLKGQAFLQAFESLKGAGAVTEQEGIKAGQAIARLNAAQSDGEFVSALDDLQEVAASAYRKKTGQEWQGSSPRQQSGAVDKPNRRAPKVMRFDANGNPI
jgi:hypothetical protein